jgi:hypothetical protein
MNFQIQQQQLFLINTKLINNWIEMDSMSNYGQKLEGFKLFSFIPNKNRTSFGTYYHFRPKKTLYSSSSNDTFSNSRYGCRWYILNK